MEQDKINKDKVKKSKSIRMGLRGKMLAGIIIPLVLVLTLIGVLLSKNISSVIETMKTENINAQAKAAATQIDEYFKPFFTSVRIVRDMDDVREMIAETEASEQKLDFRQTMKFPQVMAELKNVKEDIGDGVQAVWVSGVKNSQIMQSDDFISGDGDNFVTTERPWFKLLTQSSQGEILTGAYTDASTGNLVVTAAVAVYDGNQNIVGAVGADISLEGLDAKMSEIKIGDTGFVTVYDSDKNIIYHPDESVILKNAAEAGYSSDLESIVTEGEEAEVLSYERNGNKFHGGTTYLENIGWLVLGTMPEQEFVKEINTTIITFIGGFGLCALLLAAVCVIRANSMVRPIKKLNQVAGQLAEGDLDVEVPEFARDEIGELSSSISDIVKRLKTYILYIDEVAEVLDDFGKGNMVFELKQDYVGEFKRLKVALNNIQEAMSRTLYKITESAESVASSANQISTASQSLAQEQLNRQALSRNWPLLHRIYHISHWQKQRMQRMQVKKWIRLEMN